MDPKPHFWGSAMNAAPIIELPEDRKKAAHLAGDVADLLALDSLNFAKNEIGFSDEVRRDVLMLAKAHLQAASMAYAAHERAAALREVAPKIAGSICKVGTDVGAQ